MAIDNAALFCHALFSAYLALEIGPGERQRSLGKLHYLFVLPSESFECVRSKNTRCKKGLGNDFHAEEELARANSVAEHSNYSKIAHCPKRFAFWLKS